MQGKGKGKGAVLSCRKGKTRGEAREEKASGFAEEDGALSVYCGTDFFSYL